MIPSNAVNKHNSKIFEIWARKIASKSKYRRKRKTKPRDECNYWEIEDILGERITPVGKTEVLIKWKNWDSEHNTWEPVENLNGSVNKVLEALRQAKEAKTIELDRKKSNIQKNTDDVNDLSRGIIEDILDKKVFNGTTYYLIKWQGYSEEFNSWQPRCNIASQNMAILIQSLKNSKRKLGPQTKELMQMQSSLTAKKEQMLKNTKRETPEPKILSKKMDLEAAKLPEEYYNYSDNNNCASSIDISAEKAYRVDGKSKFQGRLFGENTNQISQGFYQQETMCNSLGLMGKYSSSSEAECRNMSVENEYVDDHVIQGHYCNHSGEIQAFKITAPNKLDLFGGTVSFWCEMEQARKNYSKQVLKYLFNLIQANLT